jgi:hypothetical protein
MFTFSEKLNRAISSSLHSETMWQPEDTMQTDPLQQGLPKKRTRHQNQHHFFLNHFPPDIAEQFSAAAWQNCLPYMINFCNYLEGEGDAQVEISKHPAIEENSLHIETHLLMSEFYYRIAKFASALADDCDDKVFEKLKQEERAKE